MNDQAIEREIQAKGLTAPRITPAHIESVIHGYNTFNVGAALRALNVPGDANFDLLTMCVIKLENGFTVTGESACASPENFDQDIGNKIAIDNAKQKIWALEGYLLKQQLHEASNTPPAPGSDLAPHQQRVVAERAELAEKLGKLASFLDGPTFANLDQAERQRLHAQWEHMARYADVLAERIAAFPAVDHQAI